MRRIGISFPSLLLSAALLGSLAGAGCAVRGEGYVRYHDGDHDDRHRWDGHEEDHYRQYLRDRHMEYRQFNNLSDREKQEYWNWRHDHP